jgi:hypothetical protein
LNLFVAGRTSVVPVNKKGGSTTTKNSECNRMNEAESMVAFQNVAAALSAGANSRQSLAGGFGHLSLWGSVHVRVNFFVVEHTS